MSISNPTKKKKKIEEKGIDKELISDLNIDILIKFPFKWEKGAEYWSPKTYFLGLKK